MDKTLNKNISGVIAAFLSPEKRINLNKASVIDLENYLNDMKKRGFNKGDIFRQLVIDLNKGTSESDIELAYGAFRTYKSENGVGVRNKENEAKKKSERTTPMDKDIARLTTILIKHSASKIFKSKTIEVLKKLGYVD
jgi:hypothetical protein